MKKISVVAIGLLCFAVQQSRSEPFDEQAAQVIQEVSEAIQEAKKTLGVPEIQTVSLSKVDEAKVLVLGGACTKKVGWGPFKRKKNVTCFALKFNGYFQGKDGEQKIEKALWAFPVESQGEAQAMIDKMQALGGITQEVSLTLLRKAVPVSVISNDKNDTEEVYLVVKIRVRFSAKGDGYTLSGTTDYSFLKFD